MKFKLEVGEEEKHTVEFDFNQLRGTLVIRVDEKPIVQSRRLVNEPIREVFQFVVGEKQKSAVRIEKRRKQLLGHHGCV